MNRSRLPLASFRCTSCGDLNDYSQLNLDAEERPVCNRCYLADPPQADVDGVFAEVAAQYNFGERGTGQVCCVRCRRDTIDGRCPSGC